MTQQSRRTTLVLAVLAAGALAACQHPTSPTTRDTTGTPGILADSAGLQARGGNQCAFGLSVVFADAAGDKLRSDVGRAYVDGLEKVMAFTGSGPGFRLDTNGSARLEGAGGVRTLLIDFNGVTSIPPAPFSSANKGVDLRFYLNDGALDLCSLSVGSSGTVGLTVAFEVIGMMGDQMTLTYGVPQDQNNLGNIIGARVNVTRTGTSTWTVAGQTAGLRDGGQYGTVKASTLTMPFTMYLVRI